MIVWEEKPDYRLTKVTLAVMFRGCPSNEVEVFFLQPEQALPQAFQPDGD
jgi:hypothetical protein